MEKLEQLISDLEAKAKDVAAQDVSHPLAQSLQTMAVAHVRDTLALAQIVAALEARLLKLGILKQ